MTLHRQKFNDVDGDLELEVIPGSSREKRRGATFEYKIPVTFRDQLPFSGIELSTSTRNVCRIQGVEN